MQNSHVFSICLIYQAIRTCKYYIQQEIGEVSIPNGCYCCTVSFGKGLLQDTCLIPYPSRAILSLSTGIRSCGIQQSFHDPILESTSLQVKRIEYITEFLKAVSARSCCSHLNPEIWRSRWDVKRGSLRSNFHAYMWILQRFLSRCSNAKMTEPKHWIWCRLLRHFMLSATRWPPSLAPQPKCTGPPICTSCKYCIAESPLSYFIIVSAVFKKIAICVIIKSLSSNSHSLQSFQKRASCLPNILGNNLQDLFHAMYWFRCIVTAKPQMGSGGLCVSPIFCDEGVAIRSFNFASL